MSKRLFAAACLVPIMIAGSAAAQAPSPPPAYGAPITLEAAKKAMAAAEAEATKNNWQVVITIVDSAGQAVMMQRLSGAQYASIAIAEGKARTSVDFRRPTKALEDVIAGGGAGLRLLSLANATPLEGGIPIIADGKIIGGIGVSGVTSQQDAQVAKAGVDAAAAKYGGDPGSNAAPETVANRGRATIVRPEFRAFPASCDRAGPVVLAGSPVRSRIPATRRANLRCS